jgi:hypothetical protein
MQAEALDAAEAAEAAGAAEAAERAKVGTLKLYQLECVRGGAAFVRGDDGHGTTAQGAGRAASAQLLVVVSRRRRRRRRRGPALGLPSLSAAAANSYI